MMSARDQRAETSNIQQNGGKNYVLKDNLKFNYFILI